MEHRPFGSWRSSLSAFDATLAFNSFVEVPQVDPVTGAVFWTESNARGRNSIYKYDPKTGRVVRWTPDNFDVRSRITNKSGGSFLVYNDTAFFSSGTDGLLYGQRGATGHPFPVLSNQSKNYGNGCYSPEFSILFYITEDMKTKSQNLEAFNMTSGRATSFPLVADYFASPVLSPDSRQLAWLQWQSSNMDEAKLLVATLEAGRNFKMLKYIQHSSIKMLKWNQYNELLYVHDATNWWNLYINNKRNFEINLTPFSASVGHAVWGMEQMAYDTSPQIGSYDAVVVVGKHLYQVNSLSKKANVIEVPYDSIYGPKYSNTGDKVYMLAGNASQRMTLIELNLRKNKTRMVLPRPSPLPLTEISQPQFIEFPTSDGEVAFGLFYPPKNSNYTSPESALPPVIVTVDEGPLQGATSVLDLGVQFFTSRGFAVFDIDHRGRGNYGRQFRQSLYENFGQMDVADVTSGTEYLTKGKMVDPQRIVVRGKFLGGVTALLALAFTDLFKAGTVYGGPSNITKLLDEAPRFESSYFRRLFSSNFSLEYNDNLTDSVSPIDYADNITAPTLFFHGTEDHLVHPNHTVFMYESLLETDVPTTMILKTGEGHHFSPKATAESLEEELSFYRKTFDIPDPDGEVNDQMTAPENPLT